MIRVFNNIRQQLAAEGKLIRYLGYAVGEIVLIVAGILIALQINDCLLYTSPSPRDED